MRAREQNVKQIKLGNWLFTKIDTMRKNSKILHEMLSFYEHYYTIVEIVRSIIVEQS